MGVDALSRFSYVEVQVVEVQLRRQRQGAVLYEALYYFGFR